MIDTPAPLIQALAEELRGTRSTPAQDRAALAELFRRFTRSRSSLRGQSYMDVPRLRAAYLRYHVPLNVARVTCVLRELERVAPRAAALRQVVDIGAGPGSASLATVLRFPRDPGRRFHLCDRSRASLAVARRLLDRAGAGAGSWRTEVLGLPRLPAVREPALVWLSMVLNELRVGATRGPEPGELLARLGARVPPSSLVVVIEPALRATGIALLKLHDAAVAAGQWRVVAPCTHQMRCPLLRESGRSWCHFHCRWNAPAMVREVADPLGLEHASPSLAFLALERLPPARGEAASAPSRARVIGDAMELAAGRKGLYVCAAGERRLLSPPPAGAVRGDVLEEGRIAASWERGSG